MHAEVIPGGNLLLCHGALEYPFGLVSSILSGPAVQFVKKRQGVCVVWASIEVHPCCWSVFVESPGAKMRTQSTIGCAVNDVGSLVSSEPARLATVGTRDDIRQLVSSLDFTDSVFRAELGSQYSNSVNLCFAGQVNTD
jgi:hypothetical protein